jgi:hypothetical protein
MVFSGSSSHGDGAGDSTRRRSTMDQFNGTDNAGRKGMAYDWQAVLASYEAEHLDHELFAFVPAEHAA